MAPRADVCGIGAQTLQRAVTLTDQQSQPRNDEAKRVLKFFMSTLLNTNMPRPEEFDKMRSLTTLVPHYSEDVIYPIDRDEIRYRTGKAATPGKGTDLVGIMEGMEISTLQFLKIQFSDEWDNFIERLVGSYPNIDVDAKYINIGDFQLGNEDGLFHDDDEARMQLMKWASERGQLLWRTTKGMMLYANALRLLDVIEAADATHQHSSSFIESKFRCASHLLTTALQPLSVNPDIFCPVARSFRLAAKAGQLWQQRMQLPASLSTRAMCRHIVAAQVYGEKAADGKGENKWIATSIDVLMKEYPTFRVAYMDKVKDHPIAKANGVTHSVLLQWDKEKDAPTELYRVRLPWQAENKHGVVCLVSLVLRSYLACWFAYGIYVSEERGYGDTLSSSGQPAARNVL
jgi:hypothetical protein